MPLAGSKVREDSLPMTAPAPVSGAPGGRAGGAALNPAEERLRRLRAGEPTQLQLGGAVLRHSLPGIVPEGPWGRMEANALAADDPDQAAQGLIDELASLRAELKRGQRHG